MLIAPPFMPGRTGDLFLPADFTRLHPALGPDSEAGAGIERLAKLGAERGLKLLLDVVPDRLAAGSAAAAREAGGLFSGPAIWRPSTRDTVTAGAKRRGRMPRTRR